MALTLDPSSPLSSPLPPSGTPSRPLSSMSITGHPANLPDVINLLVAAVRFNGLSTAAAFHAFDDDSDGWLSLADLRTTILKLRLEVRL